MRDAHLAQLVRELRQVALRPRVHVQLLGLLDEGVCGVEHQAE